MKREEKQSSLCTSLETKSQSGGKFSNADTHSNNKIHPLQWEKYYQFLNEDGGQKQLTACQWCPGMSMIKLTGW